MGEGYFCEIKKLKMKEKTRRYLFGKNINGTGMTGIVDLQTSKVVCLCDQFQKDKIIKALELYDEIEPIED